MKLRQIPEDFIVNEEPDFTPDAGGRYFVYEVTKRSLTTLDVLDILRKALRLSGRDVSASGMKDKHAITTQLVALTRPLPGTFSHEKLELKFAGKSANPLNPRNVAGNRFSITARALGERELEELEANTPELREHGVPNYYDSQRFGGGSKDGDLPGREMLKGDWERALKLHLATPRRKQAMKDKRIRRDAAKHWGDWEKLIRKLPRCRERSIIAYLVDHPEDFRGALDRVDPNLLRIYVAAYQSWLFNLSMSGLISSQVAQDLLKPVAYKGGEMLFWSALDPEVKAKLVGWELPLLESRSEVDALDEALRDAVQIALEHEKLELNDLMIRGLDNVRLFGSSRPVLLQPKDLVLDPIEDDDLNPGKKLVRAHFGLPRGSFATVIMKRLFMRRGEGE